jgi:hypothetical protein
MPTLPDTGRRLAIAAALPAAPIVLLTTGSGRFGILACALLPIAVLVLGPRVWPGWGRFGGLILVGPAVVTMVVPGFFTLFVSLFSFCPSDNGRSYLSPLGVAVALCGFAVPYLIGSSWAVGRPARAMVAWPFVMLAAIAIGIAVLALVEGGPHHCET